MEALTGSTPDSGSETVVVNLNQLTQGLSQAIDEAIGPCNGTLERLSYGSGVKRLFGGGSVWNFRL